MRGLPLIYTDGKIFASGGRTSRCLQLAGRWPAVPVVLALGIAIILAW
jgi:hypothetical protein